MQTRILFISIFVLTFCGCQQMNSSEETKTYAFLGHTYDWMGGGVRIDPRIEKMDLRRFDQIWLGGDICAETTKKKSTLTYLDQIFDLSNDNTHWAIGNHDFRNGNLNYITEVTNRPLYYSNYQDGITLIVMNAFTEHPFYVDSCAYKQKQFDFVSHVLDTVQHSSHVVLIMHNVIWSDVDVELDESSRQAANAPGQWMDMLCDNRSKFSQIYYPKLLEIQNKGIQVVLISGDGGQFNKGYYKKPKSGIEFYVSGINNSVLRSKDEKLISKFNTQPDSILIFTHHLIDQTLEGQFVELNNYLKQ